MYGNSVPAETVGGDLFEYINFQQRYDIDPRIQSAQKLAKEFIEPLPAGEPPRNSVDDHVSWLEFRSGLRPEIQTQYRQARASEQVQVAEGLHEVYTTADVRCRSVKRLTRGSLCSAIASESETFNRLTMVTMSEDYCSTSFSLPISIGWEISGDLCR